MKLEDIVSESDCWDLPALTNLHLWLLPTGDDNHVLPVRCLTCLPALRTLSLTLWDFRERALYLSLPELITLHLALCKMPKNIWNMSDTFAALVGLENLTLRRMCMQDCYIACPQLINLEIETRSYDTIEGNIVVLAPKLANFTSIGDHRGFSNYCYLLALYSISDILAISPSPFYNLKYVKLPHGFEEAGLSSIVRSYLLGGSPIATIVATLPQNIIPHAAAASVTARNVVIEETLAAPTKLVDFEDIQKTVCIDTVNLGVQEELVLLNSEVHVDSVIPSGAPVEGTFNGQVSSSRGDTDSGLWQGNEVNSKFICLLDQIMKKYPETFEHFTTRNKKFRTMKLNMLCTAVNDFTKIPMTEVDAELIFEYMDVFADLKKLGFNVSWLVNRLNYIEQLLFSQPLPTKLHVADCHNDDAKSKLQDLQIRIDDAKTELQDLQTLRSEKMQEIQKAHGTMDKNLAVGCVGDDLLSGP